MPIFVLLRLQPPTLRLAILLTAQHRRRDLAVASRFVGHLLNRATRSPRTTGVRHNRLQREEAVLPYGLAHRDPDEDQEL